VIPVLVRPLVVIWSAVRAYPLSHTPDGFLGEEFGQAGDSDRTWILDPID
jgi:fructose-1,6-bisphosphatase/inositol monophosphatase family enzyme